MGAVKFEMDGVTKLVTASELLCTASRQFKPCVKARSSGDPEKPV